MLFRSLGSAQEQHPAIRAAAEARPGGAVLMGSLTTEEIKHGITGGMTQIFACWENTVRHQPDHQGGGVVVNFVIGSRGTVNSAVVATSELNLPDTEGCIARGFERLRFPSPRGGGIVRVSYPITFDRVDRPSP